ncbi:hypothetical protein EYC87_16210 [Halieaceae bacterium IMCC8485]|uniref:CENP-V/GFA domain-containing protein n=1 Tax=Candidatus Seongchinamella marina TaxID=2518990 RepID=A0ABT3SYQ4_9GAMM|nr:hypothetical protein [Candidatus Seongchinamella marina]
MKGACGCGNIELHWQLVDLSLVPRACACDYCSGYGANWVSKSGTRVRAVIHNPLYYSVVRQGSETAEFHECMRCQLPVFASATVDEQDYAVINASCVANPRGFGDPVPAFFGAESVEQRAQRRMHNWCLLTQLTVG